MERIKHRSENPTIYYVLIVLACMNFLGKGSVVYLGLGLFELFRRKCSILIDLNAVAVAIFTLFVVAVSVVYYSLSDCVKSVNAVLLYLLGYDSFCRAADKDKCIEQTALSMCVGFGMQLVLMFAYNLNREQASVRSLYSVWTKETIAVTLLGLLVATVTGYSFYAFFCGDKLWKKTLVLIMLAVGLKISFDTATRTPIVLFAAVYTAMSVLYMINIHGIKMLRYVGVLLFFGAAVFLLYITDTFGIKSAIWGTPIFQRLFMEGLATGRVDITKRHFAYMLQYPWGGAKIQKATGDIAHNFLQECHDLYGIFATLALLVITTQLILNLVRLIRIRKKTGVDFLLISLYLAIMLQMCMEPVFSGYPILFWSLLNIHGMATAYLKGKRMIRRRDAG